MKLNKKLLLIIILLFTFITSVKALDYVNPNTNYKALIDDKADLLTDEEENKLLDEMTSLTSFGNIIFVSTDSNSLSARSYANNYYYNKFGNNNGSLFLIDMDNREIFITSGGANYRTITTAKANIITDNIYKLASNEKYYECAKRAYEQIKTLLNKGKIAEPMKYISNAVVAISLSSLLSFLIVYGNSKTRKAKYNEIIKGGKRELIVNSVTGFKSGTDRVYSPISDSSSGGGGGGGFSGGGGGGGGFSGGGGGHSF